MGFPDSSVGKESAYDAGDLGSIPGSGKFPGEGIGYLVFWPGEFHGQRSLAGYCPWGCRELNTIDFHQLLSIYMPEWY